MPPQSGLTKSTGTEPGPSCKTNRTGIRSCSVRFSRVTGEPRPLIPSSSPGSSTTKSTGDGTVAIPHSDSPPISADTVREVCRDVRGGRNSDTESSLVSSEPPSPPLGAEVIEDKLVLAIPSVPCLASRPGSHPSIPGRP